MWMDLSSAFSRPQHFSLWAPNFSDFLSPYWVYLKLLHLGHLPFLACFYQVLEILDQVEAGWILNFKKPPNAPRAHWRRGRSNIVQKDTGRTAPRQHLSEHRRGKRTADKGGEWCPLSPLEERCKRAPHWVMDDRTTQEITWRLAKRWEVTHRWQEWAENFRPVSKHHFLKYPNPLSINPKEPCFPTNEV